jgi:hypothetical protein
MARSSDPQTVALWRGRLQRFSESGLTVAQFCEQERVCTASFYNWRRKLGGKAEHRRTVTRHDVFQPVTVVPTSCGVSIQLPGGTRIEVRAEHLEVVRAVIAEVARVDRDPGIGPGPSSRAQASDEERAVASC